MLPPFVLCLLNQLLCSSTVLRVSVHLAIARSVRPMDTTAQLALITNAKVVVWALLLGVLVTFGVFAQPMLVALHLFSGTAVPLINHMVLLDTAIHMEHTIAPNQPTNNPNHSPPQLLHL